MTASPAARPIDFIGRGTAGGKPAGSLARDGYRVTVRDLDRDAAEALNRQGDGAKSLRR